MSTSKSTNTNTNTNTAMKTLIGMMPEKERQEFISDILEPADKKPLAVKTEINGSLKKLIELMNTKKRHEFLKDVIGSMNKNEKKKIMLEFIDEDVHEFVEWCEKCGDLLMLIDIKEGIRHRACEWCGKTLCKKCSGFKSENDYEDGYLDGKFWKSNNSEKYKVDLVCLSCEASDNGE